VGGAVASAPLVGCAGSADVLVVATDVDAVPLAALYAPDVAVVDGQALTLAGTYQPLAPTSLAFSNVPAAVTSLGIDRALATSRGRFLDTTTSAVPAGGAATATIAIPVATGATAITVTDGFPASTELSEQLVYEWGPTDTSYALALDGAMLPSYAAPATFDLATHVLSWQERAASAQPDFARVRVRVTRDTIPGPTSWTWRMIAPRDAAPSIRYPTVPVDGFDFNAATGDAVAIEELTNASVPGGYDAFRAHGFADVTTAIAGANGRIVVELPYGLAL
jgi:hypothetical protein